MNENADLQTTLAYQFPKGRHLGSHQADPCFVDSDEDFGIDELRDRINNIETGLSEEGDRDLRQVLDDPRCRDCFWAGGKCRVPSGLDGQREACDLQEAFDSVSANDLAAVARLCESDDEGQDREDDGPDSGLGEFVLYYGLKSDAVLSPAKDHYGDRGGGAGGGTRGQRRRGPGLDLDLDADRLGATSEELSDDYYDHPRPPSGNADDGSGGGGGGGSGRVDDDDDVSMSLFYEFHDLPHVDYSSSPEKPDDDELEMEEDAGIRSKFIETKVLTEDSFDKVGRFSLTKPRFSRKRGVADDDDDEVPLRKDDFLFGSMSNNSISCHVTPVTSRSGAVHQMNRLAEGPKSAPLDINNPPLMTSLFPESVDGWPPGKRTRYSLDEALFNTSSSPALKVRHDSGVPPALGSINTCHSYPGSLFRLETPAEKGSGFLDRSPDGLHGFPTGNQRFSSKLSDYDGDLTDGVKFSTTASSREDTSTLPDILWAISGWKPSSNDASVMCDMELGQLVAPSAVFPETDRPFPVGVFNTSDTNSSLDSFAKEFANSFLQCPAEAAESGTGNMPSNTDFIDPRDPSSRASIAPVRPESLLAGYQHSAPKNIGSSAFERKYIETGNDFAGSTKNGSRIRMDQYQVASGQQQLQMVSQLDHADDLSFCASVADKPSLIPGSNSKTPVTSPAVFPHPAQSSCEPALTGSGQAVSTGSSIPGLLGGLPFPLPNVPSGYKLVITHHSIPTSGTENSAIQKETRIIIIHPGSSPSADQPGATTPTTNWRTPPAEAPHELFQLHTNHATATPVQHHLPQQQQQGGMLRRPVDLDLPWRSNNPPTSANNEFRWVNEVKKISSPATPALDLSVGAGQSRMLIPTQSSPPGQAAILGQPRSTHPLQASLSLTTRQVNAPGPVYMTSTSCSNGASATSGLKNMSAVSGTFHGALHNPGTNSVLSVSGPHDVVGTSCLNNPLATSGPNHVFVTSGSSNASGISGPSAAPFSNPSAITKLDSSMTYVGGDTSGGVSHVAHPASLLLGGRPSSVCSRISHPQQHQQQQQQQQQQQLGVSQVGTPPEPVARFLVQSSAQMESPTKPEIQSARTSLVDGMFPPNVVIGPPLASSRHVTGYCANPLPEELSEQCAGPAGPSIAVVCKSSPPRSVEPDSTVQGQGQSEATRDIIRALSDKIRRNRTQRLLSDSLVSTTYASDASQSPTDKSGDSRSPAPDDPSAPDHTRSAPASESEEAPAVIAARTKQQQPDTDQAILSQTQAAGKPVEQGHVIIGEISSSQTARNSIQPPSNVFQSFQTAVLRGSKAESQESRDQKNCTELQAMASPEERLSIELLHADTKDFLLDNFFFFLDAPISTAQRQDDDKITYLNKGQYYRLSLECHSEAYKSENVIFRSIVMVLFRDSRTVGDELEAWKIWHSRQQSYKQRILDIDYKDACGVGLNSMQELAYNATALTWSPNDQPVKVNVAVNCLSTDFSNQKGVKGIPLHIQIDTYDVSAPEIPINRAYCKIKVFCDKGAERKVRDEERKKERRSKTATETTTETQGICCTSLRQSNFHPVEDLTKEPVLFTPSNDVIQVKGPEAKTLPAHTTYNYSKNYGGGGGSGYYGDCDEHHPPNSRRARPTSIVVSREFQRVLLYVREIQEEVFTALLLQTPTVSALAQAIHEKCNIEANRIKNIYKKSKKGILVKMDDKILRHYSNESTFVITTVANSAHSKPDSIMYDVILAEIDVDTD